MVAKNIRAGAAYVELYTKNNRLVKGLRDAEKKLKAFGAGITAVGTRLAGLGAAALTPMLAATKVFASMGDTLAKMSGRTGISVESLSELGYAADQSGADLATLEAAIRRMQKQIVDAAGGLESASEALRRLGITADQLSNRSPEDQFKLIAQRLSQIADPTLKAATAMEVFGKSGTRLLPMIAGGAAGIQELQQQARELGLTISTQDAQAAEVFGDRLDDLWKVLKTTAFTIGAALAPMLIDAAKLVTRIVVKVTAWIKQNKPLVVWLFKIAVAAAALGLSLVVLGSAIGGLAAILGLAAGAVVKFGAAVGSLGGLLASLLSPIGLVAAGVVGLTGAFIYFSGNGGKALDWLGGVFQALKSDALLAFQGISDAMAAGDIGLAANILWLTLKMEWIKGITELKNLWTGFKTWFQQTLVDWETELAIGGAEVKSTGKQLSAGFGSGLKKIGSAISAGVSTSLMQAGNLITTGSPDLTREQEAKLGDIIGGVIDTVNSAQAERDAQVQAAEDEEKKSIDDASAAANEKKQQIESQGAADIAAANAEIAKARAELDKARSEAEQKRKEFESLKRPEPFKPDFETDFSFEGLESALQSTQRRIESSGTFNAMAALGLGANSLADRTAKATENTAANTKRLLQHAQLGGPAFS